ncbi:MAG TPA: MSMEG_4193 family putative phosphomutase [Methylomirabilota bacterium]|jgi:probable phosphoglycerate mutase|nr:MSMEG_4193 family putative phosphomutase [Methylomirabilota bacterium]
MPNARKSVPPTVVLLVRHGVTPTTGRILPGRRPGLHLSDAGVKQAENAARRIAKLKRVAAIYSSPLERARETARAIARARRMPVRIERGLLEIDIGQWAGRKLDDLRKRPEWDVVQRHPSAFRFPGGESFSEMQARITGALARIVAQHPGRVIVAVSHADPIKAVVSHALGVPLDLFQRIMIGTASITAIAYGRTNATVLTVNSGDGDLMSVLG